MQHDLDNIIYEAVKLVHEGKISALDAAKKLNKDQICSVNSFKNWIVPTYKYMLSGIIVRGTISLSLRELFLKKILEEYGAEKLGVALRSYEKTINYYENRGVRKPGDEALYNKYWHIYSSMLSNNETFDK